MKRTQIKDALRNIRKHRVSYISIIVIAFLGVTTFLGIDYASFALRRNGSAMYDRHNYRDIELVSTLLLSPEDIECVRGIEGVEDAEPVWQMKVKVSSDAGMKEANVISTTERVNLPELVEGSLPEDNTQCAVEKRLADEMGWKIGDKIRMLDADMVATMVLKNRQYTVTGIVNHPDHTSLNVPDTLYIMVVSDAFKMLRLSDCCMKAEITVAKPQGIDRFGDEYRRIVSEVYERIWEIAPAREAIRTEESVTLFTTPADPCQWVLFDSRGSTSFVQLIIGSGNLEKLEMTFSLLFVLVGALVIYASVTKMVDEQRELVGTCKALGLHNREILSKYMFYGVSSTAIGIAAGVLAARLFEHFVLVSYDVYYTFDVTQLAFSVRPTVIVAAGGLLISVLATLISCGMLMRSTAVVLMRPRVPAGGRKRRSERKHILSLYFRLIVTNILRDWKRVTVTIVCVAGCCALVVIGFTLRAAVQGSLRNQYTSIVNYDKLIRFGTKESETAGEDIAAALSEAGCEQTAVYDTYISYRVTDIQAAELLCGDISGIDDMYHLRDWQTGAPIPPTDDGILIQRRIAEIYGLDVGSQFEIAVNITDTAKVRVAGIYDNYIGRYMIMSPAYYEKLFGEHHAENAYFVRLGGADEGALENRLKEITGFESLTSSDSDKAMFEASTSVVIAVVVLFIVMAAVMAGVVLLDLTNIYILQKKRELTVMRINGFTVSEVIGYVAQETIVTTVLGMVLGIVLGSGISYRIIRAMEQPFIQFERRVSIPSWIAGALITVLFTVIINMISMRQVKNLRLSEINDA